MNVAGALREEKKQKELQAESLKQEHQQQQNPYNLTEAIIRFVRAAKTDTWVSKAKEKQVQI